MKAKKKLSGQAEYARKVLPNFTDEELRNLDLLVKEEIDHHDMYSDVVKLIEEYIKKYDKSMSPETRRRNAKKLASVYLKNNTVYHMSDYWIGFLMAILTIKDVCLLIITFKMNIDIDTRYATLVGGVIALIAWCILVNIKKLNVEKAKFILQELNDAIAPASLIWMTLISALTISMNNACVEVFVTAVCIAFLVKTVRDKYKSNKKYKELKRKNKNK